MTPAQSVPVIPSWKPWSQTGSVTLPPEERITRARVNSFQDTRKPKTPVATRPGPSRGKVTRKKAPTFVQPSIMAASSRSTGTPSTNPFSIQTMNGMTVPT